MLGPDVRHLGVHADAAVLGGKPLGHPFVGGDAYVGQVMDCGPPRVVVFAPAGSTADVSWVTGVSADLVATRPVSAIPLRPDGVAVLARPQTGKLITVRVHQGGRLIASEYYEALANGPGGPPPDAIAHAVAAAPGDGDKTLALDDVRQPFSWVPVSWSDPRVLFTGRTASGYTVAAAVGTLDGGALYLWGGASVASKRGTIMYFDGLLTADRLDRTAFVYHPPVGGHPIAVFFTGVRQVEIRRGTEIRTSTVEGGLVVENGDTVTGIRVLGTDGQPLPVVDARTQLTRLPDPRR
jgi:hypothetical protein